MNEQRKRMYKTSVYEDEWKSLKTELNDLCKSEVVARNGDLLRLVLKMLVVVEHNKPNRKTVVSLRARVNSVKKQLQQNVLSNKQNEK